MPKVCVDTICCQLNDKFCICCIFSVFYPTPAWKEFVKLRQHQGQKENLRIQMIDNMATFLDERMEGLEYIYLFII